MAVYMRTGDRDVALKKKALNKAQEEPFVKKL